MASGTISEIKQFAKNHGINVPSGLKKELLIQYINGKLIDNSSSKTKSNETLDKLIPKSQDTNVNWLEHLHKFGWATLPISGWNSDFINDFFTWFENCNPNFKRDDQSTWKSCNMPQLLHGILKHYFGHTEMQWKIRELCAPIFAKIWNCEPEDLLCSFDGGCLMPPSLSKNFKSWIHVDQSRSLPNFCCVQGIVNFVDNGPDDGGLILLDGSQHIFNDYMKRHPSEGIVWGPAITDDIDLIKCPMIKICAPAGHLILWDSRIFHCNVHPKIGANFRMCTYVSYQLRSGASEKEIKKRINLYKKGRMTGHWCYGPWFKETAEHPRFYGKDNIKPPTIEIAELNPLRMRLIGY